MCHGSCDAFQFQGLACVWKSAWNLGTHLPFLLPLLVGDWFLPKPSWNCSHRNARLRTRSLAQTKAAPQ